MKIRSDFVTNSSSTVFVLIARSELTRDGICKLIGIQTDSPLEPIADELFKLLGESRHVISTAEAAEPVLAGAHFAQLVEDRVKAAVAEGHEVRIGEFGTDGDGIEQLLCGDCFEAENDEYYLNALRCTF